MVASLHTADDGGEPPPPTEKVAAATRAAACGSAALSGCTGCSPAAAAAARPGRAAARHAASRHAAAQEVRFDRQLALCSFTLHTATQVASLLAWASLPGWERFQRVLSILVAASIYVFPTVAPVVYLRWRAWALGLYRVVFFAFPLLRKARGIQRVLDGHPQAGLHGALKDLFKVVWGSRLVAVFMSSLMTPLPLMPLLPHLLVQAYSVAMVRANGSLCATPLLSHPTTAARISAFHQAMHLASMLLPGSMGQSISPALQASRQGQQCEAFLTFLFVATGLLFPVAFLLATEPPHSLRAWGARQQQLLHAKQRGRGPLEVAARAAAAAECGVRELCGGSWLAESARRWASEGEWGSLPPAGEGAARRGSSASNDSVLAGPSCKLVLNGWQRGVGWWLLLSLVWAAPFALAGH